MLGIEAVSNWMTMEAFKSLTVFDLTQRTDADRLIPCHLPRVAAFHLVSTVNACTKSGKLKTDCVLIKYSLSN